MSIFVNPRIDNLSSLCRGCEVDLLKFGIKVFFEGLLILIKEMEMCINECPVCLNHGLFHVLLKNGLQSIREHLEEVHITTLLLEMEDGQEFFTGFSGAASKDKGEGRVYAEW